MRYYRKLFTVGKSHGKFLWLFIIMSCAVSCNKSIHDDVIKWKTFSRYWPFVRGIHRSPVNSPHKGQSCRALVFSLICAWINGWENNRKAGDLRRNRPHYDATVMTNQCEIGLSNFCIIYSQYNQVYVERTMQNHTKVPQCRYLYTYCFSTPIRYRNKNDDKRIRLSVGCDCN